jgi:hypothetical protein
MANEDAKLNLHSVLAEVCEALVNIILLAPSEQRDELCTFVVSEVALMADFIRRQQGSTQH